MVFTNHSFIINKGIPLRDTNVFIIPYRICENHCKPYIEFGFLEKSEILFLELKTNMKPLVMGKNYKGFIDYNGKIYLIMNVEKTNDDYTWLIPDEIVNQKHFFGVPVSDNVVNLFIQYDELLYLRKNHSIEQPMALYITTDDESLYSLGIPKRMNHDKLSHYEPLEIYKKENTKKMRYIVFLGKLSLNKDTRYDSLYIKEKYYIRDFFQQKPTINR